MADTGSVSSVVTDRQPCDRPGAWSLRDGQVHRLRMRRGARWLQVRSGTLWLTRSDSLDDHWLLPGHALWLERGADAVVEAAGDACFELLEPPRPLPLPPLAARLLAVLLGRSTVGRPTTESGVTLGA